MKIMATILLIMLFATTSSHSFQNSISPGEGIIELKNTKRVFDAGRYEVEANIRVELRYRFSTLLGDHVEVFYPKYEILDIGSVIVSEKESGFEVFRVSQNYPGDRIEYAYTEGTPSFLVGEEIINKLQMISLDFRLIHSYSDGGTYYVDRTFPGYLRQPGKWGWDVPGSFYWDNVLKKYLAGNVYADEAREVWTAMALESEPISDAELINATFDVYALMSAITKEFPDAFKNSTAISPAFSQMSSLIGQLTQAKENNDPELARREQLTNRAWDLLRIEMSSTEREAIEGTRNVTDNDSEIAEIERIFELVENDFADDEELSDRNKSMLENAISTYTPIKLAELKLPIRIHEELKRLNSGTIDWEDLVVASDSNSKYGYKDSSGNWVIPPTYFRTFPFINGYGVVQYQEGGESFINANGIISSEKFSQIGKDFDSKLISKKGLFCAETHYESGRGSKVGLYDNNSKNWVHQPNYELSCELRIAQNFEVFFIETKKTGSIRDRNPIRRNIWVYSSEGNFLYETIATGIGAWYSRTNDHNYDIYYWLDKEYECNSRNSLIYIQDHYYFDSNMNLISSELSKRSEPRGPNHGLVDKKSLKFHEGLISSYLLFMNSKIHHTSHHSHDCHHSHHRVH